MQGFDVVETGSGVLAATISRREVLRKAAGVGLVAAAAGVGLTLTGGPVSAQESAKYQTTSALNLRTGPGLRRKVLLVIPSGGIVDSLGKSKNGYRYVAYKGTNGWAHGDYLQASNGGSTDVPVPVGTAQTTDDVNFRSEPSLSASVVHVLRAGATVDVFDVYSNGYRMVGYAQITGWIHADYLSTQGGGELGGQVVTTTALNLREEPSTSSKVLAVMPKGAKAYRSDVIANGFLGVSYNGVAGWAYMDYLETV